MANLNLDKIEWENVTVEIDGKKYKLLPMTMELNKKYTEVLNQAKETLDMSQSVELIKIISEIPAEIINKLSIYELNEITNFYYENLYERKKKQSGSKKSN